jgi:hypothetical protein
VALRQIRAVSDPQRPGMTGLSRVRTPPLWCSLNFALLVLGHDYHLLKIKHVFALQLL